MKVNLDLRKVLFFLSLCVMLICSASAQTNYSIRDRLFFGGSFGLMIGTYTDIELSPHVGYYITPRWAAGIGVIYEYYNYRDHWIIDVLDPTTGMVMRKSERVETHIFGGRLFTNYVIVNNVSDWVPIGTNFRIFAHVEYETLSYEKRFFDYGATGRKLQHSFLVGGGLRFPTGKRSSMNLTILWNLNSNMNNVYGGGPIIRIGYNF